MEATIDNNNGSFNELAATDLIHQMIQESSSFDQSNWVTESHDFTNSGFLMNTHQPNTNSSLPDLLNLLHLPKCSISLPNSNLSDIIATSCITYDPLYHLNLPPQPPIIHLNPLETTENDNVIFEFSKDDINGCMQHKGRGKRKNKPFTTERGRRCHLNGRFDALKLLIPNPTKGDKASILADGIEYINELRRRVEELKYLVEKKRCGRHKNKRHKTQEDNNNLNDDENMEKKLEIGLNDQSFSNKNLLRCSWLQRKSKVTEVDVRIVDDEVTIKIMQKKKINCLFFVSKVIDELQLDLHHVTGGQIGEHYCFLFNTKIYEGSIIYASAIADRVIEVVDKYYMDALPINNY